MRMFEPRRLRSGIPRVELMGKAEGGNGTAACSRQRLYRSQPWWVKREGEDSPLLDDLVDLVRMQTLGARAVHRSDSEIIGLASSGKVADGVACIEPN
jgi:hypothetical protein